MPSPSSNKFADLNTTHRGLYNALAALLSPLHDSINCGPHHPPATPSAGSVHCPWPSCNNSMGQSKRLAISERLEDLMHHAKTENSAAFKFSLERLWGLVMCGSHRGMIKGGVASEWTKNGAAKKAVEKFLEKLREKEDEDEGHHVEETPSRVMGKKRGLEVEIAEGAAEEDREKKRQKESISTASSSNPQLEEGFVKGFKDLEDPFITPPATGTLPTPKSAWPPIMPSFAESIKQPDFGVPANKSATNSANDISHLAMQAAFTSCACCFAPMLRADNPSGWCDSCVFVLASGFSNGGQNIQQQVNVNHSGDMAGQLQGNVLGNAFPGLPVSNSSDFDMLASTMATTGDDQVNGHVQNGGESGGDAQVTRSVSQNAHAAHDAAVYNSDSNVTGIAGDQSRPSMPDQDEATSRDAEQMPSQATSSGTVNPQDLINSGSISSTANITPNENAHSSQPSLLTNIQVAGHSNKSATQAFGACNNNLFPGGMAMLNNGETYTSATTDNQHQTWPNLPANAAAFPPGFFEGMDPGEFNFLLNDAITAQSGDFSDLGPFAGNINSAGMPTTNATDNNSAAFSNNYHSSGIRDGAGSNNAAVWSAQPSLDVGGGMQPAQNLGLANGGSSDTKSAVTNASVNLFGAAYEQLQQPIAAPETESEEKN